MDETKLCPYCAEEIKAAAIVCKHCGRELPEFEELKSRKMIESQTEGPSPATVNKSV